jgi:hypothetical protein
MATPEVSMIGKRDTDGFRIAAVRQVRERRRAVAGTPTCRPRVRAQATPTSFVPCPCA